MVKKIMNKIRDIWAKKLTTKDLCLYTFIVSIGIICIIYIINEISPFGDKSLLQVDFYHQYGPMLGELYDRVHNFSSLIYSFNMGLGLPFFRNFLNYMSSPLNIIMFFFKRNNIVTSYAIIIGLKAVISAVTMVYYLSKKHKTTELYLIAFGLLYAFSAYFSAYYWNLMWIDGMFFLPLITLGIERIIDDGKWKMYTICLAWMILANYYIGYMICIFAAIYFVGYSVNKIIFKKEMMLTSLKILLKNFIRFVYASLLALSLVAVFLLPLYFSISSISATGGNVPTSQYYLFSISDFFKYHFSSVMPTVFASQPITAPNVSSGILVFVLVLIFIINVEISFKAKLEYIILLGFFILAFFWAPLDYILQGFHVPNDLPYRYSFIYSFILVSTSVFSLKNIRKINYRLVMLGYIFLSIVLLVIVNSKYVGMSNQAVYINVILLALYFIIYSFMYAKRINLKILYIIVTVSVIVDVILSVNNSFDVKHVVNSFYSDYDNIREKINYIKDNDSELFYRIEKTQRLTLNDTSWYNYYGMTSFSSMNYEDMAILQRNLGMAGNVINSYIYNGATPVYDTMFNIKYVINNTSSGYSDNRRYTLFSNDDIYKYDYSVGLGYGVSKKIFNWNKEYTNPVVMQNEYMVLATGIDKIFQPIKIINTEVLYSDSDKKIIKYTFENSFDNLYFYSSSNTVDFMIIDRSLYYNNDSYTDYEKIIGSLYSYLEDYNEKHIINVSPTQNNVTIYVGYNYYDNDIGGYTINNNNFKKAIDKLRSNKLNITSFKETRIEGNINLDDDMVVYTSIPYDDCWHVLVDGKKVKTRALEKSLLTFEASKGKHKVIIYYKMKGLTLGIIISVIGVVVLCLGKMIKNKIKIFLKKGV